MLPETNYARRGGLHLAYQVFPDSAAAKGDAGAKGRAESEQMMLARLLKGVHW